MLDYTAPNNIQNVRYVLNTTRDIRTLKDKLLKISDRSSEDLLLAISKTLSVRDDLDELVIAQTEEGFDCVCDQSVSSLMSQSSYQALYFITL